MVTRLLATLLVLATLVSAASAQERATTIVITGDVVYGHKHGLALTYDVLQPRDDANGAGVLFMVSGGWVSRWSPPEQATERFRALLEKGFTVFLVRHGSSPKFVVPECVADVRRAVRSVRANARRFGIDPDRLGAFGGSAGGHLSLMVGTTADDGDPKATDPVLRQSSRVAAVVAYFPPTYLGPFVQLDSPLRQSFPALRFDPKQADDVSPLHHVSRDDAPSLMIHGDLDQLVKLDHSQKIHAAFEELKVVSKLIVIKGAAHGFRGEDNRKARQAMVDWFTKHLAKKKKSR